MAGEDPRADWRAWKAAGNAEFGASRFVAAEKSYTDALAALDTLLAVAESEGVADGGDARDGGGDDAAQLLAERVKLLSNRAITRMKQRRFEEALEDCDAALEVDGVAEKVRYRRAVCRRELGRFEAAQEDLEWLVAHASQATVKSAKSQLNMVRTEAAKASIVEPVAGVEEAVANVGAGGASVQEEAAEVVEPESLVERVKTILGLIDSGRSCMKPEGARWVLVPSEWMTKWIALSHGIGKEDTLGPIDMRELLEAPEEEEADEADAQPAQEVESGTTTTADAVSRIRKSPFSRHNLKPGLTEGRNNDVVAVPPVAFQLLAKWHGHVGPTVERFVFGFEHPLTSRVCFATELYPSEVELLADERTITLRFSFLNTCDQLLRTLAGKLVQATSDLRLCLTVPKEEGEDDVSYMGVSSQNLASTEVGRAWLSSMHPRGACPSTLVKPSAELQVRLPSGCWPGEDAAALEVAAQARLEDSLGAADLGAEARICAACGLTRYEAMSRCSRCKRVSYCSAACQRSHWPYHKKPCKAADPPKQRNGLAGLVNLGQTCYMNAAVQCLSHTPELTRFFLTDSYKDEVNENNFLGSGGVVARSFAETIKSLWFSSDPYVRMYDLAKVVERVSNGTYRRGVQHDSQEFLNFLLDQLHEDLNRVKEKPYVVDPEADGRPDAEVAAEAWQGFLMRNDSVVVDNFHGQYRSTLTCSVCDHQSVKFDPFLSMTLPIREHEMAKFTVILHPADGSRAIWLEARASESATMAELKEVVSKMTESCAELDHMIGPRRLEAAEVESGFRRGHALARVFGDGKPLRPLKNVRIRMFEVTCGVKRMRAPLGMVELRFVTRVVSPIMVHSGGAEQASEHRVLFGEPFVVVFHRSDFHGRNVYEHVARYLQRVFRVPLIDPESGEPLFSLCRTTKDGTAVGEELPCEDVLLDDMVPDSAYVAVDFPYEVKLQAYDDLEATMRRAARRNPGVEHDELNIEQCLEEMTVTEMLDQPMSCSGCGDRTNMSKKVEVWRLPEILIIHLNRFKTGVRSWYGMRRQVAEKISALVDFPEENLDLGSFVPPQPGGVPPQYDLYGVIYHHGIIGGGHYTSSCKVKVRGGEHVWAHFDDNRMRLVPAVRKDSAYVLFYRRRRV